MGKLFINRKLVRNPKFCRFCANHGIAVLEKGHRTKCEYRNCPCDECSKNAKKVQTSKDHRKKKDIPKSFQSRNTSSSSSESTSFASTSHESAANETTMTLKTFIESNLDDYFEDLSNGAADAIINGSGHEDASSYIQSLPMVCVDENMNEIENVGSNNSPSSQFDISVVEYQAPSRDSMVESLMAEHGSDTLFLYHALLDACDGDYAEAERRILEAKNKCQRNGS